MNADKLKEEVLNYIRFDKPGIEKLLKKCEDLYVEDDGIIDFKSEEEWNEEYFYELFPATRKNFSREKVMELLKVHDKIRGKVKEEVNEYSRRKNSEEKKVYQEKEERSLFKRVSDGFEGFIEYFNNGKPKRKK